MSEATTIVETLTRRLAVAVLRGDYPPGSRLPTLRGLAAEHGVTPATAQRVAARLEAMGLVRTVQGSGMTVLDPATHGDPGLVPLWLAAHRDRPEAAAALLADYLELRRILAAALVRKLVHPAVRERLAAPTVADAAAAFAATCEAGGPAGELAAADLALMRALIDAAGQAAYGALFNTTARMLRETPGLIQAMYAEPQRNRAAMEGVLEAVAAGDGEAATAALEAAMAELDAATVDRFRAVLAAEQRAAGPGAEFPTQATNQMTTQSPQPRRQP